MRLFSIYTWSYVWCCHLCAVSDRGSNGICVPDGVQSMCNVVCSPSRQSNRGSDWCRRSGECLPALDQWWPLVALGRACCFGVGVLLFGACLSFLFLREGPYYAGLAKVKRAEIVDNKGRSNNVRSPPTLLHNQAFVLATSILFIHGGQYFLHGMGSLCRYLVSRQNSGG